MPHSTLSAAVHAATTPAPANPPLSSPSTEGAARAAGISTALSASGSVADAHAPIAGTAAAPRLADGHPPIPTTSLAPPLADGHPPIPIAGTAPAPRRANGQPPIPAASLAPCVAVARAPIAVRAAVRTAIVATGTAAAALVAALPAAAPSAVAALPTVSAAAPATTPSTAAVRFDRPAAATGTPTLPTVTAAVAPVAVRTPVAAVRSSAMQNALGKLGARYRWGAAGPGAFDCSGLVYWSYRQIGVTLPRTSRAMSRVGTPVAKGDLQPGDLVFFYRPVSHVAIYIGNGQVVHASTAGSPVKISSLSAMPFATARRV